MFTGEEIVACCLARGATDVVWLPDSALGPWEEALERSPLRLIRVCREAEAWPLAAGLLFGGRAPVVVMQSTGLFDSGDSLRNIVFDLKVPLFAIIGARSFLVPDSPDTAKKFVEPVLRAWGLDHVVIAAAEDKPLLAAHWQRCQSENRPGVALIGEGRM